jgi:hypothetical protein
MFPGAIALALATLAALSAPSFAQDSGRAPEPHGGEIAGPSAPALEPSADQIAARAPDLLSRFIRIDTSNPPGNEIEGARFLAELLEAEGLGARLLESEPGRASV